MMPTPSAKDVDRFINLYRGHGNAYGQYTVADDGFTKVERGTFTREEAPPRDAWERHLSGKNPGMGGIPVSETGNCYWGAIDYDDPCEPKDIEARVEACGFPLVVCRSKSGGAHLYVFLIDPVSAELMMEKLRAWADALGLKVNISGTKGGGRQYQVETFPKQAKADVGNWINLPYFGTTKSNIRWGVLKGKRLSFGDWLTFAESKRISSTRFRAFHTEDPRAMFQDGPPCLQTLHSEGVGEGMRNTVVFNMALYFRTKNPDGWVEDISRYNEEQVDPPLSDQEMDKLIKSGKGRGYWYQCSTPPLCDLCQEAECKERKYGVDSFKDSGRMPQDMPELSGLTYLSSEPARWFLRVGGKEVTLKTDQLISSTMFRSAIIEQLGIYVPPVKQLPWDKWLQTAMEDKTVITPPVEMGVFGRFLTLFGEFIEQRRGATSDSDLRRGKPIEKTGEAVGQPNEPFVVFTLEGLRQFLDRHRFYDYKDTDLFPRLRMLEAKSRRFRVDDQVLRVWWIPISAVGEFADDGDISVTRTDTEEPSF